MLPYSAIHALGRFSGKWAYYLHRPFRKKALANLAMAYGSTKTETERKNIAIASFQNVMISLLEFYRLKRSKGRLTEIVTLIKNKEIFDLLSRKQGVIFFTGHQANWEIPFLAMNDYFPGIAIGRPIKNQYLYKFILSVREMNGGKIIIPKQAIRAGIRALKEGKFLGIVGDQAFPNSSYSYPLFGKRAWTASTPALLAYRTNCPIVIGITKRVGSHYIVSGSDPIWPNQSIPIKMDVERMMNEVMRYFEKSLKETPEEWMWIHNRWKQKGIDHVKRIYRYESILVILPKHPDLTLVSTLRKIYPHSFLTFYLPKGFMIPNEEIRLYQNEQDLLQRDWRFQLVLDFYHSSKVRRHFRKLGAFQTLALPQEKETVIHTLVKLECPITAFL